MEQHLQFKIGSTFSGEGFTKLKQEVGNANKAANQAASAASRAAGAMGGLDTAGSKAAGAVTGLVQALLAGGVQGALFAGAIMALNAYIGKLKEGLEQAQDRAEKLKASIKAAFSDTTSNIKSGIAKEIAEISTKFDQITKNAVAFTNAMQGLSASQSSGNIINLEIEKYNAMLDAGTESEAKHIEAIYNLKIAEENAANVANEQSAKVKNATEARINAETKVSALAAEYAKIAEEVKAAEEAYKIATEEGTDNRKDLAKFVKDLKAQQEDVAAKQLQAQNDVTTLTIQEQTAIQNQTNALAESQLSTQKANDALDKMTESLKQAGFTKNEFVDNFLAAQTAEELKEAEAEQTKLVKEASEIRSKVNEAEAKLKDAIEKYRNNLSNFNTNNIFDAISSAKTSALTGTFSQLLKQSGAIADSARENAIQQGIANGTIRTVDQSVKVGNDAAKQARLQIMNAQTKQEIREKERAERLSKMSEKAMSKADKEWLKRYNEIEKAKKEAAEAIKKREQELKDAKDAEKKKAKDIEDIRKKMEKLGLK